MKATIKASKRRQRSSCRAALALKSAFRDSWMVTKSAVLCCAAPRSLRSDRIGVTLKRSRMITIPEELLLELVNEGVHTVDVLNLMLKKMVLMGSWR